MLYTAKVQIDTRFLLSNCILKNHLHLWIQRLSDLVTPSFGLWEICASGPASLAGKKLPMSILSVSEGGESTLWNRLGLLELEEMEYTVIELLQTACRAIISLVPDTITFSGIWRYDLMAFCVSTVVRPLMRKTPNLKQWYSSLLSRKSSIGRN